MVGTLSSDLERRSQGRLQGEGMPGSLQGGSKQQARPLPVLGAQVQAGLAPDGSAGGSFPRPMLVAAHSPWLASTWLRSLPLVKLLPLPRFLPGCHSLGQGLPLSSVTSS